MAQGKSEKSTSIADEILGRKDEGSSSSSSGSYFSHVFSSNSSMMGHDFPNSEFYWTLIKQRPDTSVVDAHSMVSGNKSQGSPEKRQPAYNKDEKPAYNKDESTESTYFGSSVHYGGRDFYKSSLSIPATETQKNYNKEEGNEHGDATASRGEWWQGSLYY